MKVSAIIFLLICTVYVHGQERNDYLLVRIEGVYDNTAQKTVFIINAEGGSDAASNIYALKKYNFKKGAINPPGGFYYDLKEASDSVYNYFLTPTEALNFLSKKGWVLLSVYTEAFSGYNNQTTSTGEIVPVTTVSSRPVFCLRRTVRPSASVQ